MTNLAASWREVAGAIERGEFDENLDNVIEVLRERQRSLSARKTLLMSHLLSVGDTVRFTGKTRPQYLVGCTATVVQVLGKRAVVQVVERDRWRARRFGVGEFRCPLSLLEREES